MAVLSSSLPLPSDAMSLLPLLVEQSADLIVRFDVEGRCTYANPACFAAVSPAAPGQVFDAVLFFGEAGPTLSGALTQALKGEPVEPFELAWVSAAGEPRWHACTLLHEQAGGV